MLELSDLISIFVNNGVAVAVIIYFMFRDMKFMTNLTSSIQELKDCVKEIAGIYERKEE